MVDRRETSTLNGAGHLYHQQTTLIGKLLKRHKKIDLVLPKIQLLIAYLSLHVTPCGRRCPARLTRLDHPASAPASTRLKAHPRSATALGSPLQRLLD